jgi:hypothetical protein
MKVFPLLAAQAADHAFCLMLDDHSVEHGVGGVSAVVPVDLMIRAIAAGRVVAVQGVGARRRVNATVARAAPVVPPAD